MIYETERLNLRPPRASDAPSLFRFLGDKQVMRFTQVPPSLDHTHRYLQAHEFNREKVGYAPWVVLEQSSDEIVGFGGLYEDPFDRGWGLEVGYFFAPSAWGKGYATELVQFCLALLRRSRVLSEVRAFAHPENAASRRILLKAGFVEERFIPSMNRHLYRASLSDQP
jgi:RimJ/RimL family protein N-acetyltransferase